MAAQVGIKPYLRSVFFSIFECRMYGAFFFSKFMSGFVDSVYCVFTLPQTPHPFIRCFNVQLIYRLRTCLSVLEKKRRDGGKNKA